MSIQIDQRVMIEQNLKHQILMGECKVYPSTGLGLVMVILIIIRLTDYFVCVEI